MDRVQQGIITLLKSAITQEAYELPEGFDIGEAYPLIRAHQVSTLVYDGAVRCGIPQSHPMMQTLFQSYCKALLVSEGQLRELERIYNAFEENQIDYMPLKGCIMKAYYPKQELRLMGDADVLIRKEQYGKIAVIMKKLGFEEKGESDQDYTWHSAFLHVELHKNLMPMGARGFYSYFGDGWARAHKQKSTRYEMLPEDFFLFIFAHFAKHYRLSGIGCRHVVDLWVFLRSIVLENEEYVENELKKIHLLEFYNNIRRLIAAWFDDGAVDEKTDFLTNSIFHNGSWGSIEALTISSGIQGNRNVSGIKGRVLYIAERLFPAYSILCRECPILQKMPVLLPGVWLYFIVRKFLHPRTSLSNHRKNLSLLTSDNLDSRRRMMKYVGLDYDS